MKSVTIPLFHGEFEYEIEVTHFQPPTKATRDDPGDGGEIELGDTVKVWYPGDGTRLAEVRERIPLIEFVETYARHHGITELEADRQIRDTCFEDVLQQYADDFDDRDV